MLNSRAICAVLGSTPCAVMRSPVRSPEGERLLREAFLERVESTTGFRLVDAYLRIMNCEVV